MFLEFAGIVFEFTPSASYIQKIRNKWCPLELKSKIFSYRKAGFFVISFTKIRRHDKSIELNENKALARTDFYIRVI